MNLSYDTARICGDIELRRFRVSMSSGDEGMD